MKFSQNVKNRRINENNNLQNSSNAKSSNAKDDAKNYFVREPIVAIYWITVVILGILGSYAAMRGTTYAIDAAVFIAISTIIFIFRKNIVFSTEGALFCSVGMLMNLSGMFGAYNLSMYGVGWDKFLHLVTSMGLGFLVYSYLKRPSQNNSDSDAKHDSRPAFNLFALAVLTIFIVMGLGALNEITEFIGSRYLGFTQGILGTANGSVVLNSDFDYYDTQWDLIANTIAVLIAVAILSIDSSLKKKHYTKNH